MEFDRRGFDRQVGLRMQRARKARGITQEQLAARIGLPRPSYANIESGRQRIPIDVVWRVAVVLAVSIATLVPEPLNSRKPGLASVVVPISSAVSFQAALPGMSQGSYSLDLPLEFSPLTTLTTGWRQGSSDEEG
jgi:transcriptional regulator with XRE-family HTH domain